MTWNPGSKQRLGTGLTLILVGVAALSGCNYNRVPPKPAQSQVTLPTIIVTLKEFSVSSAPASAAGGKLTFQAENKGPKLKHQLIISKTTLAPANLPTAANGSVDESKLQIVGRIAAFGPQMSSSTIFTLAAGKYVLFCNLIATSGSPRGSHYKLGMRGAFTVS